MKTMKNLGVAKFLLGFSLLVLFLCGLILGIFLGWENCVCQTDRDRHMIAVTE